MSSVKGKFPSISIKRKPKTPSSPASSQLSQSASSTTLSQIFRPLTPDATRKFGGWNQAIDSCKEQTSETDRDLPPLRRNASDGNLSNLEAVQSAVPAFNPETKQTTIIKPRAQRPGLVHRPESVTSFHDRSSSVNSEGSYYNDLIEAPMIEQEDIIALTHHVRAFSEALGALRNTFFEDAGDPPEVKAHERLGEVLSILKGVLNKYTPLHSTEILAAAGTLISKVKSHNYEESNEAPDEFCESIDQLALAFSSSVSDFLMGDQDVPLSGSRDHSRNFFCENAFLLARCSPPSLDDLCDEDEDDGLLEEDEDELDDDQDQDFADEKDEQKDSVDRREVVDKSAQKADELDRSLIGLEHGVDLTLQRSKIWSKYAKDIATYLERRAHLELEFTNKLAKLAHTTRQAITEERYLPFQSIFVTSLDQDIEYAETCSKTYNSLLSTKFLEPLQARRNKHEQIRKELKDMWTKAYKRLNESIVRLEKAKQTYIQRQQDLEKSKTLFDAKEGQEPSASFSRTTKKKQEDTRKAEDAEEMYSQCVSEANVRQRELENTKSHVLLELRQLIYQCDMTMKAVTCNYFHMMNTLSAPAPVRFQILAESSRAYEPGTQFADFVQEQMATSQPTIERVFTFEPYSPGYNSTSQERLHSPSRHNSAYESRTSLHSPSEDNQKSPFVSRRHRSLQITGSGLNSSHPPIKAWTNRERLSDVESNGSKSAPPSPNTTPPSGRRSKGEQSSELMESSDEESGNESDSAIRAPARGPRRPTSGPFRDCRMSHSAMTHKFKKLRAPSKCRDCDSYVYFNGAECYQCGLTCHKKCLARLTTKCTGHKGTGNDNQLVDYNRARRMTTFGVDFYDHILATDKQGECVPYIVSSCINEINERGLHIKGIYRVSGVKSKVEKLCQAFENGTEVVDLSSVPPHVIAAVLKLYLRQLPEPLLTFKLYPEFMRIAKESFRVIDNLTTCKSASEDVAVREEYDELVRKLRKVVVKLPKCNFKTASMIIEHLNLVARNEEENSMSSSNLGIVFGPTLLKPRESSSSDSVNMSALMDMPNQTRVVELLITNQQVFDPPDDSDPAAQETPVEDFTRTKPNNTQNLGIRSVVKGKDMRGVPIETILTTEDGNLVVKPNIHTHDASPDLSLARQNLGMSVTERGLHKLGIEKTPPSPTGSPTTTGAPRTSAKISLGFGNDFFELLAKSNERIQEPEKARVLAIPEFLLPGSTDEKGPGDESDLEDMDDDSNTQGTSGSQTPDDDLGSSRNSQGRISHSDDSLDEKVRQSPDGEHAPFSTILPESANKSRSPSVTVSFGSDFQDAESLLPDLSDKKPEKPSFENFQAQISPENQVHRVEKKTVDDAAIPSKPRRPHNLGLFKRNSDLPGMIARGNFFPLSLTKNTGSEPDVAQKGSEKRLNLFGAKKHPGIADAIREMHHSEIPEISSKTGGEPDTGGAKKMESPRGSGDHMFPVEALKSQERSHLLPALAQSSQETEPVKETKVSVSSGDDDDEPLLLESKGIEVAPSSPSRAQEKELKDHPPTPYISKIKEKRFEFRTETIDSDSGNVVPQKPRERLSPKKSNGEEKPAKAKEGPPVAEKNAQQNGERRGLTSPDSQKAFAFAIEVDKLGKTADQDRLSAGGTGEGFSPSTSPKGKTVILDQTDGALFSDEAETGTRLAHRISVKDRKKQYEQLEYTDGSQKTQTTASVGNSEVSSRKQMFEESPRYSRRDSYKKLNDLTMRARRDAALDGASGSDNGSGNESRNERPKPLIGQNISERLQRLDSSSRRREKIETPERPRSLILDNLRVDKIESLKQEKYKTTNSLDRLSEDKTPMFTSREVDIPLDSPEAQQKPSAAEEESTKIYVDKSLDSAASAVRGSPKPSRRSPRPHFPEDKSNKKREPQFV